MVLLRPSSPTTSAKSLLLGDKPGRALLPQQDWSTPKSDSTSLASNSSLQETSSFGMPPSQACQASTAWGETEPFSTTVSSSASAAQADSSPHVFAELRKAPLSLENKVAGCCPDGSFTHKDQGYCLTGHTNVQAVGTNCFPSVWYMVLRKCFLCLKSLCAKLEICGRSLL